MNYKKFYYINFILFLAVMIIVFIAGLLIIKNINSLSAAAEDDNIPPVITNIQAKDISATSSVITWETDKLSDSLVNYSLNKNYGIIRDPRFDKTSHEIILENLLPDMIYYFRITSSDSSGNQGISGDYSFTTPIREVKEIGEGFAPEVLEEGEGGLSEKILEEGRGGLSEKAIEELLRIIENVTSEETLERIKEALDKTAEEVLTPPTIILDYADVEIGTNWAIITWETDKESNSIVALAAENNYNLDAPDNYIWKEGDPDEMVLEHRIEINGLTPATVYHFQVSSESEMGLTGKSDDKTFKTKSILPEIYNIQIIKIEEESATINWMTNVPCSSIIEYTNLDTNESRLEGNSSYFTVHSMQLSNLIFDTYYSAVIKVESEDGEKAESEHLTFITVRDEYPPIISKVNTESTLYPGSENKIQTIASWRTDEPAQCQLFYHQGLVLVDEPNSLLLEEDFSVKHVQVATNFIPSTVYKFWIICDDEAKNKAKSENFTMLTPSQEESIIDIILKNFESTFGWVKKLKS